MIHVSQPSLLGREAEYVQDALERNELSWRGSYVKAFEDSFANYVGTRYAISCSSGTAALHLSLIALGIGPGDDVLVPSITYVAVANVVKYVGANVVVVDVDPATWNIDPNLAHEAALKCKNPKALIAVHLFGLPCDMRALTSVCHQFGMHLVEDACEAHGASYDNDACGSLGKINAFSFFANKLIACGEGGMVTTDNASLYEKVVKYRGQGQPKDRQFYHDVVGYNYRMTNLQAAVGLGQLETLQDRLVKHQWVADVYRQYLHGVTLQGRQSWAHSSNWMVTILVPKGKKDALRTRLAAQGVETRPVFVPLTMLPMYKGETPKVAKLLFERGVSLPTHSHLTQEHISMISSIVLRETAQ